MKYIAFISNDFLQYHCNFGNGTQYIDPNKRKYKKAF